MNDETMAMMAEDKLANQTASTAAASTDNKVKKSEAGVKIKVGQTEEEKAPKDNQKDVDMVDVGIADSENPYMTDMSGAYKKTINYGEMPLNEIDTGTYIQEDYVKEDGTYQVKN